MPEKPFTDYMELQMDALTIESQQAKALEFDEIAERIFAPIYPVLAAQVLYLAVSAAFLAESSGVTVWILVVAAAIWGCI